jgi:N-acetylglucosamine kinase-like BadF-type ATPase
MILVADGGSTKVDWIALDQDNNEVFRTQTLGLNPNVVCESELENRIDSSESLKKYKNEIKELYFYGAGCGTPTPTKILKDVFVQYFSKTETIEVEEDILAAVYASAKNQKAIVCILGTGSNSCYFDGNNSIESISPSLGYTVMDEASGNYYGKRLLRDYFYKKMPEEIASFFRKEYNLKPDDIKHNLYKVDNPNRYLASFAKFMFDHQEDKYIKKLVKNGFKKFFNFHILGYKKSKDTPIYFIGSIAYYFQNILEEVAQKNDVKITGIIRKPIDNLIQYHKERN